MITQSLLKELLNYNPDTGDFTWVKPRFKIRVGEVAGSKKLNGYIGIMVLGRLYQAHRLVWLYVYGEWPDCIDHINRIKDDNRWINLRNVTHVENNRNRPLQRNNKSGVTGVSWSKANHKWSANIKIKGKVKFLGQFKDKFEAICVRMSANNKYGFHKNHGRSL